MKKNLLLLSSLLLVITSCGGKPYTYTNPEEPQMDYGPVVEEGVNIDGVCNESYYDNENVYRIDNLAGASSYAEVKFGFAPQGLLAYAYVHESEIYENQKVVIYQQDSFELYINPGVYKDELRSNCAQFRASPSGRYESWRGMKSPADDYQWTRTYVPFRHTAKIDGKLITTTSQSINEDYLNSDGVAYELYIPWTSLDLDYNPKGLEILPAVVTANSTLEDDHVWSSYNGVAIDDLKNYISVGNREFKDQTGNVFNTDLTSSGFNLDYQTNENYAYVTNFGYHDQYALFNAYSTKYYARASVNLYNPLENDKFPKVGIGSVNTKGTTMFLLDPRESKDCYEALLVERPNNTDWLWSSAPVSWAGEYTYSKPITMEVIRLDNEIFYFMNGIKIFNGTSATLQNEASYPALMTMNYAALFDNCYVTTNEDEIKNRLEGNDPYLSSTLSTGGFINDNGTYIQNGGADQYGVFKKSGASYTLSVDITLGDALNGDQHPKIGIGEMSNSKINGYLFDPKPAKNNYEIVHVSGDNIPGQNNWVWGSIFWGGAQTYNRTFNLKLMRINETSYV